MEIRKEILEFLEEFDVQDALVRDDIRKVYEIAESWFTYRSFIRELTSILMQAGVDPLQDMTEIPEDFLYEQENITEFNIPDGITKIGDSAFEDTDLESVTIPDSVKEIRGRAFADCTNLKTVKLPVGIQLSTCVFLNSGLESIELKDVKLQDSSIFSDCKQLKSAIIKGDTPSIPYSTFEGCGNLTRVELPASLKEIESNSFYNCSKLKEINYVGTANQWKDIKISSSNARLFRCKIICSGGVLKYDKTAEEWVEI